MKTKFFNQIKTMFALAFAVTLLLPASPTSAMPQKAAPQAQDASAGTPTDRIIIKFEDGSNAQADPSASALMDALSASAGVSLAYGRAMSGDAHILQMDGRLPIEQVEAISASLSAIPGVEYAEPDYIMHPTFIPNDPQYGTQWHYSGTYGINAPTAWDYMDIEDGITGFPYNTVVAVLDTGITSHPDLAGRTVPGYDFVDLDTHYYYDNGVKIYYDAPYSAADGDGRDSDPSDPGDWLTDEDVDSILDNDPYDGFFEDCQADSSSWHGTHVAGTIAANSNNSVGVAGVDWNAKILPVRVLGKCGGYTSDIADGIYWASGVTVNGVANPNPARVLNMSLGGAAASCPSTYQNAINTAVARGSVVVVAAGNENMNAGGATPANCAGVIPVAATGNTGSRATYSNYGTVVKISAPGNDVLSTSNSGLEGPVAGNYVVSSGTSMATPHVSGVISLMLSLNPNLTSAKILEILQATVTPFPAGSTCTTSTCGAGIVNAGAAVRKTLPDLVITNVTLFPTYPSLGDQIEASITVKNQGNSATNYSSAGGDVRVHLYVDRNPDPAVSTTLYIDEKLSGGVFTKSSCDLDGGGNPIPETCTGADEGDFHLEVAPQQIGTLNPDAEETYELRINNTVSGETPNPWTELAPVAWASGTHDLYAYVDSDGSVTEGYEKNNHYAKVTINSIDPGRLIYPEHGASVRTQSPIFKWNRWIWDLAGGGTTEATKYEFYLAGPSGVVLYQTFDALSICTEGGQTCSLELGPDKALTGGSYSWYMRGYSPAGGYTAWSNNVQPTVFTVLGPTAPRLLYPVQAADLQNYTMPVTAVKNIGYEYAPILKWQKVETATWYRVYVWGTTSGSLVYDQWQRGSEICGEDIDLIYNVKVCSVQSPQVEGGLYEWYVQSYGPTGYGSWSNIVKPMYFQTNSSVPGAPNLLYPVGADLPYTPPVMATKDIGKEYTPTYKWQKVETATWYRVYVWGTTSGSLVYDQWKKASDICGTANDPEYGVPVCSVVSPELSGGKYEWYVQTYGPGGYGAWSNNIKAMYFQTDAVKTGTANLLYPVGVSTPYTPPVTTVKYIATEYQPTYRWEKVAGATWYRVYVWGTTSGSLVYDQWKKASDICKIGNECSVESPLLSGGTYEWYVQSYGPMGYGDWSNGAKPMYFQTDASKSAAPTLLYPVGADLPYTPPVMTVKEIGYEYAPALKWQKVETATWYRVYVWGTTSGSLVYDQWKKASDICGTADDPVYNVKVCSVQSPQVGGGLYEWYVQSYGPTGYGNWSNNVKPMYFHTNTTAVSPTSLIEPGILKPGSPANIAYDYNPTLKWTKVQAATWYRVYVWGTARGVVYDQWLRSSDVCKTGDVCMIVSPTLPVDTYEWYVQTYGPAGYGDWAHSGVPMRFYNQTPDFPKEIKNLSPSGLVTTATPTFSWSRDTMAIWYRLYIKGEKSGVVKDQWYRSVDVCVDSTCSVPNAALAVPGVTLAKDDYTWWIQPYSWAGYGSWKSATINVRP